VIDRSESKLIAQERVNRAQKPVARHQAAPLKTVHRQNRDRVRSDIEITPADKNG